MQREIIYVPQEKVPVFGFRTPEKPVEVKDFGPFESYLSAYALVQEKGGEVYDF